jgi:hypothetical protein
MFFSSFDINHNKNNNENVSPIGVDDKPNAKGLYEDNDFISYILDGYMDNYTKPANETFSTNMELSQTNMELSISKYDVLHPSATKYDLIDASGYLIYKTDNNFKETLPKLNDAVLEDTTDMLNYQKNISVLSGIGALFLLGGVIAVSVINNRPK